MPRLAPVPAAKTGPLMRIAYWYSARRFGQMPEPFAVMAHSKPVFTAMARHELAVERRWTAVDKQLVDLAVLRTALTVECPWCVDFGSKLVSKTGLPPAKVEQLTQWRTSDVYSPLERLVLEYAEAMTATPSAVTDELVASLREHLSDRQLVELTSYVALENARARFNTAMGIDNQGFSAGSCAVPSVPSLATAVRR